MRQPPAKELACGSRFPVAFRRTGIRLLGHRSPAEELGLPHGRLTGHRRTSTGLSCCACTRHDRAGRLLYPGDGGAHPVGDYSPTGTRRSSTASPYGPAATSHRRGSPSRDINGGSHHSPITPAASPPPGPGSSLPAGLLLACSPRMEREPLGLFPELRTPQLPATHVEAETGHSALAQVLHPRHQPNLQRCLPLALMHPHAARTLRQFHTTSLPTSAIMDF